MALSVYTIYRFPGVSFPSIVRVHLESFGSVAHHEARPDSNVDMLVEFSLPAGFSELVRLGA